jgi:glycosyltransferase involved in cell wall biosynthesis
MVANFRPQKDHMTLLHAWSKVMAAIPEGQPRPRLLLAGAHQESFNGVHQMASDLYLLDSVTFLGQVRDILGILTASDIGVLTSTHEGLPNAILEYMDSGLPVVATDLPGNREALGCDAGDIFCRPGDPDDLALRLHRLIKDPSLRKELGDRNRQRAQKEFSVQAMCEKTVRIITDLLSKPG